MRRSYSSCLQRWQCHHLRYHLWSAGSSVAVSSVTVSTSSGAVRSAVVSSVAVSSVSSCAEPRGSGHTLPSADTTTPPAATSQGLLTLFSMRCLSCTALRTLLVLLLLSTSLPCRALASEGDRSPHFQACVHTCLGTGCAHVPPGPPHCDLACPHFNRRPIPWELHVMRWSCADDCGYACMWLIEANRRQQAAEAAASAAAARKAGQATAGAREAAAPGAGAGAGAGAEPAVAVGGGSWAGSGGAGMAAYRAIKYHGKWPFVRVWGMQEVVSVVLSVANLAAHLYCCRRLLAGWGGGRGRGAGHSWRGARQLRGRGGGQEEGSRAAAEGEATTTGRATMAASERGFGSADRDGNGAWQGVMEGRAAAAAAAGAGASPSGVVVRSYPYLWLWVAYTALHVNAWWVKVREGRGVEKGL